MSDFLVTGIDVNGLRVVDAPSNTQLSVLEFLTVIAQEDQMNETPAKTQETEKPKPRTVRDINGKVREIKSTREERRAFDKRVKTAVRQESKKREDRATLVRLAKPKKTK